MKLLSAVLIGIGTGMLLSTILASCLAWFERQRPCMPQEGFWYYFGVSSIVFCFAGALTGVVVYLCDWPLLLASLFTPASIMVGFGIWSANERIVSML